uniref:Coiled-coil domain-containing protein 93 n=1 Tax=Romanomermis culicivorax TaxID=13658 RepID=A0A915JEE6_ROMCU
MTIGVISDFRLDDLAIDLSVTGGEWHKIVSSYFAVSYSIHFMIFSRRVMISVGAQIRLNFGRRFRSRQLPLKFTNFDTAISRRRRSYFGCQRWSSVQHGFRAGPAGRRPSIVREDQDSWQFKNSKNINLRGRLENQLDHTKSVAHQKLHDLTKLIDFEKELYQRRTSYDCAEKDADQKQILVLLNKKVELLKELLSQRDEIKKSEQEFKDRCKKEAASFEEEKRRLNSLSGCNGNVENGLSSVQMKRDETDEALSKVRQNLASVSREISRIERKLDEIPSNLELNQYRRRFIELYNQISTLQKELKKFYILYNTLCDHKSHLEKEINLMNSIFDLYDAGMQGDQHKMQFVEQLEQIQDGIYQTKLKVSRKLADDTSNCDELKEMYKELTDRRRFYYKVVSDFRGKMTDGKLQPNGTKISLSFDNVVSIAFGSVPSRRKRQV